MTKYEYLESQRGNTYTDIVTNQPMEIVQGSLLKEHYQEIKTVLASGLRMHLETFVADDPNKLATLYALKETFDPQYLADPDFKVNFNVPEVFQQYQMCIATGALPEHFANRLLDLAKYKKSVHNISKADCADYFGKGWPLQTTAELVSTKFILTLDSDLPEDEAVRIEYRVNVNGIAGAWVLAAHPYVRYAGDYAGVCATIPKGSDVRAVPEFYPISGTVTVL